MKFPNDNINFIYTGLTMVIWREWEKNQEKLVNSNLKFLVYQFHSEDNGRDLDFIRNKKCPQIDIGNLPASLVDFHNLYSQCSTVAITHCGAKHSKLKSRPCHIPYV